MRLVLTILLLLVCDFALAQLPPLPQAAVIAPPDTNVIPVLTWNSNALRYAVYSGPSRAALTNRSVITSNYFVMNPNTNYAIAFMTNRNGVWRESALAYWPSNTIGAIVYQIKTNSGWIDVYTAERFTNNPVIPQMEFRAVKRITGYQ